MSAKDSWKYWEKWWIPHVQKNLNQNQWENQLNQKNPTSIIEEILSEILWPKQNMSNYSTDKCKYQKKYLFRWE